MMFKKYTLISIFCVAIMSCASYLEINNENVQGSWKAQVFESTVPGISEEIMKAGEEEFLSSIYTLNADHSLEMKSNYFNKGAKGNWELNPETKELSMFYSMDTIKGIEKFTVISLKKNEIVLRQDIEQMDAFVQLTLTK